MARKGVAYSGYRKGQDPRVDEYPSEDEIREDLNLLIRGGWTFIRLFDSGEHAQRVLRVIREDDLDIKVQLGVWISGGKEKHDTANQKEIAAGVELANEYSDIIIAVSVGNEVLSDWSSVLTPPEDLAEYILQVREEIEQPVTTDEMYPPFQMNRQYVDVEKVVEVIDFVSVHVYAFIDAQWSWNWRQKLVPEGPERAEAMMDAAMNFTKTSVRAVRAALDRKGLDLPIIIGEAGWKTRPTKPDEAAGEKYRAHPVNQKIFYDRLLQWVYGADRDEDSPDSSLYFEAFDEPWKGSDDGWGLFDVERVPKLAIWCDFPDLKPEDAPAYAVEDAVYFIEESP